MAPSDIQLTQAAATARIAELGSSRQIRSSRQRKFQMAALTNLSPADFLDSVISLLGAFILGTLIGAERQYRQRSGGLRTNVLVAVGSATVEIGRASCRE